MSYSLNKCTPVLNKKGMLQASNVIRRSKFQMTDRIYVIGIEYFPHYVL